VNSIGGGGGNWGNEEDDDSTSRQGDSTDWSIMITASSTTHFRLKDHIPDLDAVSANS